MTDPYPGRDFQDALRILKQRFPEGNIYYQPVDGMVFITVPLSTGKPFRAALKWQEAKYLAYSDLTGDDLKAKHFPPDWPR